MFRIMRGISLDHTPAYPNPLLRFPDGTPIPIYVGDDLPADSKAPDQAESGESDEERTDQPS